MRKFYDISPQIFSGMLHYPSDPPVEIRSVKSLGKGDSSNLSLIRMGSHSGAHIDAPKHLFDDGEGVDLAALDHLIGICQVVDARGLAAVDAKFFELRADSGIDRILIKSDNSELWKDPDFSTNYVALTQDGAMWAVQQRIVLIGIDYLSIEAYHSAGSPVHQSLLEAGIVILEGVDLSEVDPGVYQLICLPLRLRDLDGSPVRAVLVRD